MRAEPRIDVCTPQHSISRNRFLLAGNGAYTNRGCEAILRGTIAILRRRFGASVEFVVAPFASEKTIRSYAPFLGDKLISHIAVSVDRFSKPWLFRQCGRLGLKGCSEFTALGNAAAQVRASLQIGGDNYSLDYGIPQTFFNCDRYLLRRRVPVFLWAASVGPFDTDPQFAPHAHAHLKDLHGIFVRERRSLDYLQRHGLGSRVRLVADPAFVMEPQKPSAGLPPSVDLGQHPVGINFSPLMARYVTGGDLRQWEGVCADIIIGLMHRLGENILLIPHVFQAGNDDGEFLAKVSLKVRRETGTELEVSSRELSAPQIKWIISQCSFLIGARTHATIAAFSTGVPTLSLAYSVKAHGLNEDIFDTLDYCLDAHEITPERVIDRTLTLIGRDESLRERFSQLIPKIQASAYIAADYLDEALSTEGPPAKCAA